MLFAKRGFVYESIVISQWTVDSTEPWQYIKQRSSLRHMPICHGMWTVHVSLINPIHFIFFRHRKICFLEYFLLQNEFIPVQKVKIINTCFKEFQGPDFTPIRSVHASSYNGDNYLNRSYRHTHKSAQTLVTK